MNEQFKHPEKEPTTINSYEELWDFPGRQVKIFRNSIESATWGVPDLSSYMRGSLNRVRFMPISEKQRSSLRGNPSVSAADFESWSDTKVIVVG